MTGASPKNRNCGNSVRIKINYVGFLHTFTVSPFLAAYDSSRLNIFCNWTGSFCQGQVVSIEHVSYYPEPLSASYSTHKASPNSSFTSLIKRDKRRGDKGQPCFTPLKGTVELPVLVVLAPSIKTSHKKEPCCCLHT